MKRSGLGIAVVGAGRIGTLRARLAAKHPAVRYLAISDRDPSARRRSPSRPAPTSTRGSNDEIIDASAR